MHHARAGRIQTVICVAVSVVFNPTVVVINEAETFGNHFTSVQLQGNHAAGLFLKHNAEFVVTHCEFAIKRMVCHGHRILGGGFRHGQCSTLDEGVLCVSHGVAGRRIACGVAISQTECEQGFLALLARFFQCRLRQFEHEGQVVACSHVARLNRLGAYHVSVAHHVIDELEVGKAAESISVAKTYAHNSALQINVGKCELHELVCPFHFSQLGTLVSGGGDDAVAAEVALVRSGVVISGVEAVNSLLDFSGVVYGLVHPVPNAAADASIGIFDNLPVFAQIADGVTHGVGIFADKHGLVQIAGVLVHPCLAGIHFRIEV